MMPPPLDETQYLRGFVELDAVDLRLDHDGQIRLSIAISLKRIADELTRPRIDHEVLITLSLKRIADAIAGNEKNSGIVDFLRTIANVETN